jgi:predicted MFS family arabinose efflux permease
MVRRIGSVYREAFAGLPEPVWLLSITAFINRSGTMVLPFLSLYLTRELGFTKIQTGYLLAMYGLGSVAGSFLGGWLSDRIGALRVQLLSLVTAGFGFLILAGIQDPIRLGAFMFVLSIAVESFRPAVLASTAEFAPKLVLTRAMALLRLAANLGMAIGPAIGGWLAVYDYHWLFIADAFTCWAAAVVLFWRMRGRRPIEERHPTRSASRGRSPFRDGPFLILMVASFLIACVFFQIFSTLPLYLREVYRFREDLIGSLLAMNALVIVLVEMVLVRRIEHRDQMRVVALGGLLVCAGFAMMPFGSSVAWAVVTILVWTTGEMLALPFLNAVVAHRAGPGSRGWYMGLFMTTFSLAVVVAPLGGTAVYQELGPELLWYGIGALGVVIWILCAAFAPVFRHQ